MHIGFRYHVASLVAVSLSLVLGILIGGALFQDDRLVQEQGIIISDLEDRFRNMEIRTRALQDRLTKAEEKERLFQAGWEQVRPVLVKDRLANRVVAFYSTTEVNWEPWQELMELAGAQVLGAMRLNNETLGHLAQLELGELDQPPIAIVWVEGYLDQILIEAVGHLTNKHWTVSFLQPLESTETLSEFQKSALIIGLVGTPWAELALVEGLGQGLVGAFGVREGAAGLLPALEPWWELSL